MASIKCRTRKARQTVLWLKEIWRTSWLHLSGWTMMRPVQQYMWMWWSTATAAEQAQSWAVVPGTAAAHSLKAAARAGGCDCGSFLPVSPGGYVFVLRWQCLFAQLVASCCLFPSVHADYATDPDLDQTRLDLYCEMCQYNCLDLWTEYTSCVVPPGVWHSLHPLYCTDKWILSHPPPIHPEINWKFLPF